MSSAKLPLVAAVICFLLALVVPTAALTVGESQVSDDVVLEATDDRYATIEDGKLALNLSAVANTETQFTDVFRIETGPTADEIEAIWIDNDVEGVTFHSGGSKLSSESPIRPSAGEAISVGVTVDSAVATSGTETFTVVVEYEEEDDTEADIRGSNLSVSPTTVETGETVTVNATYRNEGDGWGTETVALTVNGTVVEQRTIALSFGDERTVTFEREMQWPGTYEVGIAGVGTETVTVESENGNDDDGDEGNGDEDQTPEDERIAVSNATVTSTTIADGGSATIEATVRNPTDRAIERTLELAVDGIVVDTRTVSVPANSERTVAFQRSFDEPGTYELAVSGVSAGTVTVEESEGFSIRNRELSPATTAAMAPPVTGGLLFLAIAANRRWAFVR